MNLPTTTAEILLPGVLTAGKLAVCGFFDRIMSRDLYSGGETEFGRTN
jgi:hypothetical protein